MGDQHISFCTSKVSPFSHPSIIFSKATALKINCAFLFGPDPYFRSAPWRKSKLPKTQTVTCLHQQFLLYFCNSFMWRFPRSHLQLFQSDALKIGRSQVCLGLRAFYYLVQDLKCFVLAAIAVHFRVRHFRFTPQLLTLCFVCTAITVLYYLTHAPSRSTRCEQDPRSFSAGVFN
jgi:hypothetical protein